MNKLTCATSGGGNGGVGQKGSCTPGGIWKKVKIWNSEKVAASGELV